MDVEKILAKMLGVEPASLMQTILGMQQGLIDFETNLAAANVKLDRLLATNQRLENMLAVFEAGQNAARNVDPAPDRGGDTPGNPS